MIYLILLTSLILRFILINQSLWLDESINILAAKNLSFWQFVTGYPIGDFHPPGYFALIWIWTHLFGFSEFIVRLPSVLFGILGVYFVYLIGKNLFSKKVGLLSAFFLAINPLHVYYSQEARMYSFALFAVVFSYYGLIQMVGGKKQGIFIYSLSLITVLYSDYLAYLVIISQLIFLTIWERQKIKQFFLSCGLAAIFFVPWLFIFPEQLLNGSQTAINVPGWGRVVGGSSIKNLGLVFVKTIFGRISFENKVIYGFLAILSGVVYLFLAHKLIKNLNKNIWLIVLWVFAPVLLAFLISFKVPVLAYFRLLFIVPGVCLLIAVVLNKYSSDLQKIFLFVIVGTSLLSLIYFWINPKFQRENWRGLVEYLQAKGSNSLFLFEDSNLPAPFVYYQGKSLNAKPAIKNFPARTVGDIIDVERTVREVDKVYLVDYLVEISDPKRQVDKKLTDSGWVVRQVEDFPTLGYIYEYSR